MLTYVGLGVWSLQAIFAIVVLGLSVSLMNGQRIGDSPTTTRYGVFTGAFGFVTAVFGIVSLFLDAIPSLIVLGVDALSGLLLLGGGIAFAIGLRGISCNPDTIQGVADLVDNPLLNQGRDGDRYGFADGDALVGNCKKAVADQAMQFVTFGVALGTIFVTFLFLKNGRSSGTRAYV